MGRSDGQRTSRRYAEASLGLLWSKILESRDEIELGYANWVSKSKILVGVQIEDPGLSGGTLHPRILWQERLESYAVMSLPVWYMVATTVSLNKRSQ